MRIQKLHVPKYLSPTHWIVCGIATLLLSSTLSAAESNTVADAQQESSTESIKQIALIQPSSVSTRKTEEQSNTVQINPNDLRIAAKWRTNLLIRTEDSPQKEIPTEAKTRAIKVAEEKPAKEVAQIETQPEIPDPTPVAEVLETPESTLIPEDAEQEDNYCYTPDKITSLSVDIALPSGKLPTDNYTACAQQTTPVGDNRLAGGWAMFDYHWSATGLCHRPLYFEEVNAERYGYTRSYVFQPVISAVRFFVTIPALPYKMAVDCPRDCIYTLGHYRPGSCNPWRNHRLPLKLGAAAVETGFIAGLILLIP